MDGQPGVGDYYAKGATGAGGCRVTSPEDAALEDSMATCVASFGGQRLRLREPLFAPTLPAGALCGAAGLSLSPRESTVVEGSAAGSYHDDNDRSSVIRELPSPSQDDPRKHRHDAPRTALSRNAHSTSVSLENPATPRFVGDLNPEARLLDETTSPEDAPDTATGEVGVWLQPRPRSSWSTGAQKESPSSCPQPQEQKFHPIIPILNEEEYRRSLSHFFPSMPLVHAVCLVVAKDSDAGTHLKLLQSGDAAVPVRQFCSQLHASLAMALLRPTSIKRMTLVRILGLLSLHHEGCDGAEQASSYIALAVHYAQSMAWHLHRPKDHNYDVKRTFWCLWTLDRLNAAIHSRPCCMADMDIAIEHITPAESGSVAFDVWFLSYPPSGLDSDFPSFEQVIHEMHAWQLPPSTIATLQVFYLATAILSHRLKTIESLPSPTPSRLRQQLSSVHTIRYMRDSEFLKALHPLPIVVYAVSLALSVSYQQLRYSRLAADQDDAHRDFNTACDILQALRRKWEAADLMASLAHRISAALDKLPNLRLLHVDRPRGSIERHGAAAGQCNDREPSWHLDAAAMSGAQLETQHDMEAMDLFVGMDDISWMYLDAENPISFDSFPLLSVDG
ncbi:hypothetical protein ACCO45_002651 [Purpureocillium lilacinum]|uniref:Uncharacterized protein n=1 Tax=Purpureocillium lilacinum TaxID=33203 RepID=A0ACC4EAN1_PURLI